MPKNLDIVDVKPSNNVVFDYKPKNDSKSSLITTDQLYTVNISAGQSMGLLLALTYKEGFSVISSKSP
jgi:hypothetical protein